MTQTNTTPTLSLALEELKDQCPDMRYGQMLATLQLLGEDMFDRNLWEIEDDQLFAVVNRFRDDLRRREEAD